MSWLLRLLPPYNLARLFAFTRKVEEDAAVPCAVCAVKDEQLADLRRQAATQQNYILSLLGQRPIYTDPPKQVTANVVQGRPNLKQMRRQHEAKAVSSILEKVNRDGMEDRANQYAEDVKTG